MNQYVLRIGDREYRAQISELTADRATVVVNGTEYAVDLVQFGRAAGSGAGVRPAAAAVAAGAPTAAPAAAAAPAPGSSAAPQARPAPADRGEGGIVAPMPGLVLSIAAREGQTVTAGQTLLVMEAMKMENAVAAPYAGTVAKIYVREGDAISEGDLLVHVSRPKMTAL